VAMENKASISEKMTREQIDEAQKLSREWLERRSVAQLRKYGLHDDG